MAQTRETRRPTLVAPRAMQTLETVRSVTGGSFDPDIWHVMDERDNHLIEEEILHGAGSNKFVYSFDIAGSGTVAGISVIGARHLAAHYGGMKHRLVASQQKIGSLFTFTSFPAENMPMNVTCAVVHELGDEPDFYGVVVEISDIKTGNSVQVECRENRYELRRDRKTMFERPHYAKIAQSKAYRNGVLDLLPQDILIRWREQMLRLGKSDTITASIIDEKRANVLQFAAQKAIALDRYAVERLTLEQIAGLGDAVREGSVPAFVNAAKALDLELAQAETGEVKDGNLVAPRQAAATTTTAATTPDQQQQTVGDTAPAGEEKTAAKTETAEASAAAATTEQQPRGSRRQQARRLFTE